MTNNTDVTVSDYGVMATVTVRDENNNIVARAACFQGNISPTERQAALRTWAAKWAPDAPAPLVAGVRPLF